MGHNETCLQRNHKVPENFVATRFSLTQALSLKNSSHYATDKRVTEIMYQRFMLNLC